MGLTERSCWGIGVFSIVLVGVLIAPVASVAGVAVTPGHSPGSVTSSNPADSGLPSTSTSAHADSATFEFSVLTEDRGDVVTIPILLANSSQGARATLQIGSLGENDYVTNLTVVDENGDGTVVVEWNTFMAGVNDLDRVFSIRGSDSIANWEGERGPFVQSLQPYPSKNYTTAKDATLEATSYEMEVVANGGDNPSDIGSFADTSSDDFGTISLSAAGVSRTRLRVAPDAWSNDIDRDWIADNLDANDDPVDGNLSRSDQVATDEIIVQEIQARGLEGVLRNRTDAGQSLQAAFLDETKAHLNDVGDRDDRPSWQVEYATQSTSTPSGDRRTLDLTSQNTEIVADYANDTYYIVVDLADVDQTALAGGQTRWANFSLARLAPGSVLEIWTFRDASATLDTGSQNRVIVRNASDQTISGTTTVAPGTLLELRLTSQSDTSPFLKTPTARVGPNRTFSTSVDVFSSVDPGTNFSVSVRRSGVSISDEYDGVVKADPSATVTFADQAITPAGQTVVVDEVTLSGGGFVAIHRGSASGQIIGTSQYLSAGSHSDVRVSLNQDLSENATLVAMPHLDDNFNQTFDFPAADAPVSADGTIVTDTANVTVTTVASPVEGVSDAQFEVVAGSDGQLQRGEVVNLVKSYLRTRAVDNVAFERPQVTALLRYYLGQQF